MNTGGLISYIFPSGIYYKNIQIMKLFPKFIKLLKIHNPDNILILLFR